MASLTAFVTEIFTPEDSVMGHNNIDPVTGTVKALFWVGAAMVFTILVSGTPVKNKGSLKSSNCNTVNPALQLVSSAP